MRLFRLISTLLALDFHGLAKGKIVFSLFSTLQERKRKKRRKKNVNILENKKASEILFYFFYFLLSPVHSTPLLPSPSTFQMQFFQQENLWLDHGTAQRDKIIQVQHQLKCSHTTSRSKPAAPRGKQHKIQWAAIFPLPEGKREK